MKRYLLLAAILFTSVVSASSPQAAKPQAPNNGSGAKDGGACQVTSGPNTGKKGTYTEGGTWCEGSWGGTECGNSKCKAAAATGIHGFPPGLTTVLNDYFAATQPGADPAKLKMWEQKYNGKATHKANGVLVITLPNSKLTFDGSSERLVQQFKP